MTEILSVLSFATPVAIAATGETLNQKAGTINFGIEGSMLMGAYFGMLASLDSGSPWLGMLAGTAAGLALAMAFGWFTIKLDADQVVTGTALNLLALGLTGTLFQARFGKSGQLLSAPTLPNWNGLNVVMLLTLILPILVWWILKFSRWGLAIRAVGEKPEAAEASGFRVSRLRLGALAIAGLLAGLAGAYLSLGIAGSFAQNMTNGRGFVAIAMVTFGRWKPVYVLGASLMLGYADSLQYTLQAKGIAIPHQLLVAAPYVLALAILVVAGRGTLAPTALGIPYNNKR